MREVRGGGGQKKSERGDGAGEGRCGGQKGRRWCWWPMGEGGVGGWRTLVVEEEVSKGLWFQCIGYI